ncbi:MAG: HAMP domain-containing histidine kinase [Cyclobacteriaceae bacterium]|nr:HAMP domain-containing histidine kinase [Cyclobacteriaceae bacterium]UYN85889.1 MAG: HAMP domain-containing histidine kinase [Cyclobacteriaceae bacterium]
MQFLLKDKVTRLLFVLVLIFGSFGLYFAKLASRPANPEVIAAGFSKHLSQLYESLEPSVKDFREHPTRDLTLIKAQPNVRFIVINDQDIVQWTDNQFIPPIRFVLDDFTFKYLKVSSGDFLLLKWNLNNDKHLVAIVPLHVHYKIQNDYLEPWYNPLVFGRYEVAILDPTTEQGHLISVHNTPLFRCVIPFLPISSGKDAVLTVIFTLLSITVFFILIFRLLQNLSSRFSTVKFFLLAGSIVLVRYLMIDYRFPAQFIETDIFSPKYFASSELNPSLGDLFLNSVAVAVLCLFLFLNFFRHDKALMLERQPLVRWPVSIFAATAVLFGALFPFIVIQTIYNNSAITLNISESLSLDALRILAFISVVLSWISSFLFMHVFIRLLVNHRWVKSFLSLALGVVAFIVINELTGQRYSVPLITGTIYVMVVVFFRLYSSFQRFSYVTFSYFFSAIVFFSISGVLATHQFSMGERVANQLKFANSFLIDKDDFGEFLLAEAMEKIAADFFIQSRLSGPFVNREAVRQKVRQVFIPGYFNKYTIDIHLYGTSGESLDDTDAVNFTSWIASFDEKASQTAYEGIYYFNRPDNESARKYLVVVHVKRGTISAGYIVLELLLKRVIPDNVYPGLLVDNRFRQAFGTQAYSNAIWVNEEIQYWSGEFNYAELDRGFLKNERLYKMGVRHAGYIHTASRDASGRVVMVSSPAPSFIFTLADFSFLLIVGLSALLLFLLGIGLVDLLRVERLLLSTRIQLILNLAFFIPLIAVSVITLGLTARSNLEQLNADYLARSRNFTSQLSNVLTEWGEVEGAAGDWNFARLCKLANLDANLFTPSGRLQFTSQPLIFENQLLSPFINPAALDRIQRGDRFFIADERVGKLNYFIAYSALLSPNDGSLLGILGIPFFQSQSLLENMQITVLANILTIFTAIFIVLAIVSFWVAQWLTFPLRMITQKLGRISLTQSNQPLEWQSDDEIGLMVREYNQMLSTLSESKNQLERVQREKAWREIAQQVAHEIKNPLTPMKLMLQQTERLPDTDPKTLEKIRRAIASILDQVDTLDGIASSFSTFAKMPEPVMRPVELVGLLKRVVHLHEQTAVVELFTELDVATVQVDEQLISRIFSNIILNGIQAAREGQKPQVSVSVKQKDNVLCISFTDNGTGIRADLKDKIFLPHFSTKQSGSGLGLAIARQGIEQMGGRIYFESTPGEGSIFFVELPRALE